MFAANTPDMSAIKTSCHLHNKRLEKYLDEQTKTGNK